MSRSKRVHIIAVLALLSAGIYGVNVKKISIDSFALFQKGEFSKTRLDHQGRLHLGPASTVILGPQREYYLCFDIAEDGTMLLGCGHGAEVFSFSGKDSQPVSIFKSEEPDVHAVLRHRSGAILVATGPSGKLYKIDDKGTSSILFDPRERFIWDLVEDRDGSILVAVGGSGGVYRVGLDGKAGKVFETEDPHITTLHLSADNTLYAGSGERGIVYLITKNKTRVLFDSPYREIRGISSDSKGNVYFAATHLDAPTDRKTEAEREGIRKIPVKLPQESELRSVIYRYHPNSNIEEIFSLKNETIHDLDHDQKSQQLLVATGNSGRVFQVQPNGEYAIIFESDAAQVYRISARGPGVTMITNNSAGIVQLDDNNSTSGVYVSDIFDLGIQSRIGKLYWQDSKPEGAQVAVSIRAGNSSRPDSTWTAWLPPFLQGDGASTNLSAYRFVQCKVSLNASGSGKEPVLEQLHFYYLQDNLSPRINAVQISSQPQAKENGPTKGEDKNGNDETRSTPRNLTISWSCQDPNDDPLSFTLLLNPLGSEQWFPFKSDLSQRSVQIPSGLFQDGRYRVKVIASDALTNPPNLAKQAEIVSTVFTIDATPPLISQYSADNSRIRFTVEDEVSTVSLLQFSWNGDHWYPLFPDDLISDSRKETYTLKPDANAKILFIKAIDEFGNGKVFQKDIK